MFNHRGFSHDVEALHFKVIALCAIFCLLTFGPCTLTGTHNLTGYDEYGSFGNDLNSGSENVYASENRKRILPSKVNLENICRRSDLFCFPSTLSSFFSDFHSEEENVSDFSGVKADNTEPTDDRWSSNRGNFQLLNGNGVSCSLQVKESVQDSSNENDTPFVRVKSSSVNDFSSLNVQISHPLLDWGQKYLHFPSLAYLTVENRHKGSDLYIFKPYSTNTQFYPCNYSEVKVGPGETASLCFVFLPQWLGSSSGHLILQTSSGAFLVQAQGFAVDPPYMIQASVGLSPRVVSVFNPSDKVLYLKEVSAWISFSSGNISYSVKGVCSVIDETVSSDFSVKEWLDVKIGQLGQPVMAIRPQKTWTVDSNRNEPILELEFPHRAQANIHGSLCVQLLNNASRDDLDTIVFEEFGGKSRSYNHEIHISTSLIVLKTCDASGTTSVSLLVDNHGPDLLNVVKINEVGENMRSLQTKYVEGLILFPHTVTQVATVTYTPSPSMDMNCKLVVQTNKSNAPELEVSCSDIASLCSPLGSYAGYGVLNDENAVKRSSNVHVQPQLEIKATEMTKADESVLGNWRSQGTKNGMSVLDDHEVMFPMVHIGSHQSTWIRVVNPSDQPVVMQLLLNSGEIINECHGSDEIMQPSSSYNLVLNNHMTPSRYGFSIAQNALTEAYVHPHGMAVLGPIVFHPSNRCSWKSSALVRNNLSGVEWLSLRGSGGSVSLMLLDGSDPVHTIELKNNYGKPFMKVLFAKNTGDFPVKVNGITVSGTKCELHGFAVSNSKGFALQPGESRKIIISYRSDICEETVRRDLELDMAGGILVVPLEVILPMQTISTCNRLFFWIRFKKIILAVLVSLFVLLMACSCTISFTIRNGNLSQTHSSVVGLKPETMKKVATSSSSTATVDEASKPECLTVKTGKDKARRRKKKKNLNLGVTGLYEVSSSHSSNSAPPSPLAPSSPPIPKKSPEFSPSKNVWAPPKEKPCSPKEEPCMPPKEKPCGPPKEKPCGPPKTDTPSARAPEAERNVENSGSDDRFKYNILDYHLQLRRPGSSEVGTVMPTDTEDNKFSSFFERSPEELFKTSQADTVSSTQVDQ